MTLAAQKYDGTVDGANAYGDAAAMRAYFEARGVDLTPSTDADLGVALVLATDFLDSRYTFVGDQLRGEQGTACPRYLTDGTRAHSLRDVNLLAPAYLLTKRQWQVLTEQCFQLARRALVKPDLAPDPSLDASGLQVVEKKTVAGPVETSKKFAVVAPTEALMNLYPAVELALRTCGLISSRYAGSGTMVRG